MKAKMKRFLCSCLLLALVISLFAGLTVTTYAEQKLSAYEGATYSSLYEGTVDFTIYYATVDESTAACPGLGMGYSGTKYWIGGTPTSAGSYYVKFKVYSSPSDYIYKYFTFHITKPSLSVSASVSDNTVTVSGTANAGSNMFFYRDGTCVNPGSPVSISGGTASWTDKSVDYGSTHSYKVGVNLDGTMFYSSEVSKAIPAKQNPVATLSGSGSTLTLTTSGFDPSKGYCVYYFRNTSDSTSGGTTLNVAGSYPTSATTSYTTGFNGLTNEKYWFYASMNVGGTTIKSNTVCLTNPNYKAPEEKKEETKKEETKQEETKKEEEKKVLKVTKSPTSETVSEGGNAMFISAAENYTSLEWRIVTKDGKSCWRNKDEITSKFSGVEYKAYKGSDGREYLELSNIPLSMDGYYLQTKFFGADSTTAFTKGDSCLLTVLEVALDKPVFSTQPTGSEAKAGEAVTLQAAATAKKGTVQYQWYSNSANNTTGAVKIEGATSGTYTPPQTEGTIYYFCTARATENEKSSETVYSSIAAVTYAPAEEAPEEIPAEEPAPEPEETPVEEKAEKETAEEAATETAPAAEETKDTTETEKATKMVGLGKTVLIILIIVIGVVLIGVILALFVFKMKQEQTEEPAVPGEKAAAGAAVAAAADSIWKCTACGVRNLGRFCAECGAPKPAESLQYKCNKCGWEPADPKHPPKFCPNCGDVFGSEDVVK